MRTQNAVVLAMALLPACVHHWAEESATERFRFEVSQRPRIEVEIVGGSIEILGDAESREVSVLVTKLARGVSEEVAQSYLTRLAVRAEQEEDTIRVRVKREGGWRAAHGSLRSNVELRVPRGSDLELTTRDGRIEIRDVQGQIRAESGDGRIRLYDVDGTVQALENLKCDRVIEVEKGIGFRYRQPGRTRQRDANASSGARSTGAGPGSRKGNDARL